MLALWRMACPASRIATWRVNHKFSSGVGETSPSRGGAAGDQFGIEAGTQDNGGFSGTCFAQQVQQRQCVERFWSLMLRGTQFAIGII